MFVDVVIYRDVELTEKLDYSSVVALGFVSFKQYSKILMVAALLIAFVTTYILYLKFYKLDYGKVFSKQSPYIE